MQDAQSCDKANVRNQIFLKEKYFLLKKGLFDSYDT